MNMDGIMRMKMMRAVQLDYNCSDSQECLRDNDVVTLDDDFLGEINIVFMANMDSVTCLWIILTNEH